MHTLSLTDLYKLEYEEHAVGVYRWIHPAQIQGYNAEEVRKTAYQRYEESKDHDDPDKDFEETPDTLITDYLCACLDKRNALVADGLALPRELDISPDQYIDALIYLIARLGSNYACYRLGSTDYHTDNFILPEHAESILTQLREAWVNSADFREKDAFRSLMLEIFHLGYPWESPLPRFHDSLRSESNEFLIHLLQAHAIIITELMIFTEEIKHRLLNVGEWGKISTEKRAWSAEPGAFICFHQYEIDFLIEAKTIDSEILLHADICKTQGGILDDCVFEIKPNPRNLKETLSILTEITITKIRKILENSELKK
ncbi:MAG: hypothetical protein ABWY06_18465 [Pseudomonas sp.]|uniref:hypothetical protein n=1 Tax=Pseudomonas sp. TaxID=306 RepID=UPI0033982504